MKSFTGLVYFDNQIFQNWFFVLFKTDLKNFTKPHSTFSRLLRTGGWGNSLVQLDMMTLQISLHVEILEAGAPQVLLCYHTQDQHFSNLLT